MWMLLSMGVIVNESLRLLMRAIKKAVVISATILWLLFLAFLCYSQLRQLFAPG